MTSSLYRISRLTALILALAMVASLAWQGWGSYRDSIARADSGVPSEDSRVTVSPGSTGNSDLPALASVNLFGKAQKNAEAEPVETDDLPETNLQLTLKGAMAGDENALASALIEGQRGETEVYFIGDALPGNAELRSVHPTRVVIERGGKLENLYFPESSEEKDLSVSQERSTVSSQGSRPEQATSTTSVNSRQAEVRRRLEALRERLQGNRN